MVDCLLEPLLQQSVRGCRLGRRSREHRGTRRRLVPRSWNLWLDRQSRSSRRRRSLAIWRLEKSHRELQRLHPDPRSALLQALSRRTLWQTAAIRECPREGDKEFLKKEKSVPAPT